jgi:hypothetical protein
VIIDLADSLILIIVGGSVVMSVFVFFFAIAFLGHGYGLIDMISSLLLLV